MLSIFKWSGSKRSQVDEIISNIPDNIETYCEPFVGSGIVMLTLLKEHSDKLAPGCKIYCSDTNNDLIHLWHIVKDNPESLYEKYKSYWNRFNRKIDKFGNKINTLAMELQRKSVYQDLRYDYNESKDPYVFFFLMRTCVNGLIRYNNKTGDFNASCHFRRPGMHPDKVREILYDIHDLLVKYDVKFFIDDYNTVLKDIPSNAVVYLDPPYYESYGMYYGEFDFNIFNKQINEYPEKYRKILISFDGKPVKEIDFSKYDRKKIYNGKSGFNKLHKKDVEVYESLYISK